MNRVEKEQLVSQIKEMVSPAATLVVMHYKGLSVAEISELRAEAREAGAGFKVSKNRLAKLALEGTKFAELAELFTGPTAIAYSEDPVAAAKIVAAFSKKNEKLIILGGAFENNRLDEAGVKHLASMPSLDELRAKLIALIQTPATRVAGVLQAPAGQLARVIKAYSEKSE